MRALVALLTIDPFTEKARQHLQNCASAVVVSDFAEAEFTSVVARRVRTGTLAAEEAGIAFSTLDEWVSQHANRSELTSEDISTATRFLRDPRLALRTPDALHVAIAKRLGAQLLTFDKAMARAAATLGLDTVKT